MEQEKFIDKIIQYVTLAALEAMEKNLTKPAGRQPDKLLVEMSKFYNSLDNSGRDVLRAIIKNSIDEAIFGFLCVLDGARNIDIDGELLLVLEDKNHRSVLNRGDYDLHDIYNDISSEK